LNFDFVLKTAYPDQFSLGWGAPGVAVSALFARIIGPPSREVASLALMFGWAFGLAAAVVDAAPAIDSAKPATSRLMTPFVEVMSVCSPLDLKATRSAPVLRNPHGFRGPGL
jgi:hypothetical protein